jgi:hypothetical protein
MPTVLELLLNGKKFDQDFCVNAVLPELAKETDDFRRQISVYFSRLYGSHNEQKIIDQLATTNIARLPHLGYSPELSSCDCWLFNF